MFNVIETPWLLLSAAFVLLVVITVIRRSRPEKRRWWQLFLPAVLVGSAFALDFFVKMARADLGDYKCPEDWIELPPNAWNHLACEGYGSGLSEAGAAKIRDRLLRAGEIEVLCKNS